MGLGKLVLAFALCSAAIAPALADSGLRNGLPATAMDSFVYEAGPNAEAIYGDESIPIGNGTYSLPPGVSPTPIAGFEKISRIDSGIYGQRAAGLTTGHGSYMPDAWGRDEFTNGGPEFSLSGNTSPVLAQPPGFTFDTPLPLPPGMPIATLSSGPMYGIPISGIAGAVSSFPSFAQAFPSISNIAADVTNAVSDVTNTVSDVSNTVSDVTNTVSDIADTAGDFGF